MGQQPRSLLALGCLCLLPLLAVRAGAKCLGSGCPKEEENASKHGLLAVSGAQCSGRDREFPFQKKWQTNLRSELLNLEWSGGDDQWLWALTTGTSDLSGQHHHVYWSKDHGETMTDRWEDLVQAVHTHLGSDYKQDRDDGSASVIGIIVHKDDPRKVLLWGEGPFNFLTTDGGESFTVVPLPEGTLGLSHEIRPHPTEHDWLLTIGYRNTCYPFGVMGCALDMFLSRNFGRTWNNLTEATGGKVSGFLDFDWGYHNGHEKYQDSFAKATILATGHTELYPTNGHPPPEDLHLFRTDDFFGSVKTLASCGAAFELVAGQVFFVHPDICNIDIAGKHITPKSRVRDAVTLYVSRDGSDFAEVCMPTELSDAAYTMISAEDGRGNFMIADHQNKEVAVSNMYANGNIAELYTLSLRNVHFGFRRRSRPDIKAVKPVRGRFVANQYESLKTPTGPIRPYDQIDAVTVSKITHNQGASWDYIYVDSSKVRNQVCRAQCPTHGNCYLHLHGASSWVRGTSERPSLYASNSAPGIVMATGNLGANQQGLKMDTDALCTWLSRDGGMTWTDVIDDVYIYEYLNHGNIIVMAKFREEGAAKYLYASLDQGQCFYRIAITDGSPGVELYVNNILVEPDGDATIAHVAGSLHFINEPALHEDVLITLDLKEVLMGKDTDGNTYPIRDNCDENDFEWWVPTDENGAEQCIMGKKYSFRRIKRNSRPEPCFLPKDYKRPDMHVEGNCDCHQEDLYCEYGFEKTSNSKCEQMSQGYAPVCMAVQQKNYRPSDSHLRLSHGQECPNLDDFITDTDGNGNMASISWSDATAAPLARTPSYGHKAGRKGSGGWIWFLFIVLAIGGTVVACMYGPPALKEAGSAAVEACITGVIMCIDGAKGLWRKATVGRPEDMGFERLNDSQQDSLYAVP